MKRVTAVADDVAITPDGQAVAAPGRRLRFRTVPMPEPLARAVAVACTEVGMREVGVTDA